MAGPEIDVTDTADGTLDRAIGFLADTMREIQRLLYEECRHANWDPEQQNTLAEEVAHLHEEVSEVFRAWRKYHDTEIHIDEKGKPQGVPIELADVLIGLFYNAEREGIDLMAAVVAKHQHNLGRDYVAEGRQLHGGSNGTS